MLWQLPYGKRKAKYNKKDIMLLTIVVFASNSMMTWNAEDPVPEGMGMVTWYSAQDRLSLV